MKYYATKHLKERLLARNIKEQDVYYCIQNHDSDYPSKVSAHCHYYVGSIQGKKLRVLVDNKHKTIITAFWLDSQRKGGTSQ